MSNNLRLFLIAFAVFWLIITSYFLKKNKLPVKYSLVWYVIMFIMLILGAFPDILMSISKFYGFQVVSNFVIGIIFTLIMFLTLVLTIIVADQKRKITILMQEVSMLKAENESFENKKKR